MDEVSREPTAEENKMKLMKHSVKTHLEGYFDEIWIDLIFLYVPLPTTFNGIVIIICAIHLFVSTLIQQLPYLIFTGYPNIYTAIRIIFWSTKYYYLGFSLYDWSFVGIWLITCLFYPSKSSLAPMAVFSDPCAPMFQRDSSNTNSISVTPDTILILLVIAFISIYTWNQESKFIPFSSTSTESSFVLCMMLMAMASLTFAKMGANSNLAVYAIIAVLLAALLNVPGIRLIFTEVPEFLLAQRTPAAPKTVLEELIPPVSTINAYLVVDNQYQVLASAVVYGLMIASVIESFLGPAQAVKADLEVRSKKELIAGWFASGDHTLFYSLVTDAFTIFFMHDWYRLMALLLGTSIGYCWYQFAGKRAWNTYGQANAVRPERAGAIMWDFKLSDYIYAIVLAANVIVNIIKCQETKAPIMVVSWFLTAYLCVTRRKIKYLFMATTLLSKSWSALFYSIVSDDPFMSMFNHAYRAETSDIHPGGIVTQAARY